jgi:modulator of FtsH protease
MSKDLFGNKKETLSSLKGVLSGNSSVKANGSLVSKTYNWVGASLLSSVAGIYAGMQVPGLLTGGLSLLMLVLTIGLIIALNIFSERKPLNAILLFSLTFVLGLVMSSPIYGVMNSFSNGVELVINTALLTAVSVTSLSLYAMKTKRDFSVMRGALFIALIVYIVAALLNMFFFQMPLFHLFLSATGVVIFSLYLLVDTQALINREYGDRDPIYYAVGIYLDIVNIFLNLLTLITAFFGEE